MNNSRAECFGILDKVFPVGSEGLREIVPACCECPEKGPCLKTALKTKEGLALRGEVLDRTPATGFADRIKRWSERKDLSRLAKQKQRKST